MAEHERDERVFAAYRGLGREVPPAGLDAAILAAAHRPRRRWAVPASIAAVVVLAVGVTLRVQLEHPEEAEPVAIAPRVLEAPATPPVALPEAKREARAADAAPRREVQGTIAPASPPADRLEAGRASVAAKLAGKPEAPGPWLERIARLRAEGKDQEADKSLAEFKRRYPDYEIAEAMRARIERR